jgi:uncharacterized membrane protein
MLRTIALAAGALSIMGFMSLPAQADMKLCNKTDNRVAAALGHKDKEGWITEGWWTVEPQQCVTLLKGKLIARYYYIYALDYTEGGSWGGNSIMCTRDKVFTIRGIEDCEARGYRKTGFFEVDTKEQTDWTVSLSGDKTTQGQ